MKRETTVENLLMFLLGLHFLLVLSDSKTVLSLQCIAWIASAISARQEQALCWNTWGLNAALSDKSKALCGDGIMTEENRNLTVLPKKSCVLSLTGKLGSVQRNCSMDIFGNKLWDIVPRNSHDPTNNCNSHCWGVSPQVALQLLCH